MVMDSDFSHSPQIIPRLLDTLKKYQCDIVVASRYVKGGKIKELACEGIFVEIGRVPNTGFVKGFLEFDDHNHIKVGKHCETRVDGVFAAGDVTDIHEYQYVIAAGQGCTALLSAARKE